MKSLLNWLLLILTALVSLFWVMQSIYETYGSDHNFSDSMYHLVTTTQEQRQLQYKTTKEIERLFEDSCVAAVYTDTGDQCSEDGQRCVYDVSPSALIRPECLEYKTESHMKPPKDGVRAVYMSSYVAASKTFRDSIIRLIERSDLNAVVIDIKEVEGYVNYQADLTKEILGPDGSKSEVDLGYQRNLMQDIDVLIEQLHEKGIYVIGRVVVFKDKKWVLDNPGDAVQHKDRPGEVWRDYGGKAYVDPGAEDYWDYIVKIGLDAYQRGFDEINLDYIRYPSDGNMRNVLYPQSGQVLAEYGLADGRSKIISDFSRYVTEEMRDMYPDILISGDVFGMVATARDDVTIGQRLEPMLLVYDYISPMVYPSHYPRGFVNLPGHPDQYPYEVVYKAQREAERRRGVLIDAVVAAQAATTTSGVVSESSGDLFETIAGQYFSEPLDTDDMQVGKLRPWLQDFTCTWCAGSKPYRAAEVQAQIDATNDAGQAGWMLWDAGNKYRGYRQLVDY